MTLKYWHHQGDSNENIANSKSKTQVHKANAEGSAMVWLFVVIAITLTKLQASQRANVFTFIAQYIYMYLNSKFITISMFIQCVHLFYRMPIVSCGI